jgi:hypothetical protein
VYAHRVRASCTAAVALILGGCAVHVKPTQLEHLRAGGEVRTTSGSTYRVADDWEAEIHLKDVDGAEWLVCQESGIAGSLTAIDADETEAAEEHGCHDPELEFEPPDRHRWTADALAVRHEGERAVVYFPLQSIETVELDSSRDQAGRIVAIAGGGAIGVTTITVVLFGIMFSAPR